MQLTSVLTKNLTKREGQPSHKIIMKIYSKLDLKKIRRKLKYGDAKIIVAETGMSPAAVSQVIGGVYYNQNILDIAWRIITEREEAK